MIKTLSFTETKDMFQVRGFKTIFIHKDGYVFKALGHKKKIIPIYMDNGVPKIRIGSKKHNFIFLMISYFGDERLTFHKFSSIRFTYKMKDNFIPFYTIRYIKNTTEELDDERIYRYKCKEKSISSNARVSQISTITPTDVLNSLIRTNFRCFYCNDLLNQNTWELEHVKPISKGGQNKITNITPSCKKCNRMKGSMEITDFIMKCYKIIENFKDSSIFTDIESKTFINKDKEVQNA